MVYFDNSATTPLSESAKNKIVEMLDVFGNPSSLHSEGFKAEKEVSCAREIIAKSLSVTPEEIYFTSCGTESDNIALFGAVRKNKKAGNRIIITDSEHPAVENAAKELENEGLEVIRLKTAGGELDFEMLRASLNGKIIASSIMRTNNETGAIYDTKRAFDMIRRDSPRAICHTDCVQAYMKEKLSPAILGADMISISAHKVHAPKGVGALCIKKGIVIPPRIFGGGQEKGMKSGTENTVGIASFGASVGELMADTTRIERMGKLREYIISRLSDIPEVVFNIPENPCVALVNISIPGFRSETLLHYLSSLDIYVSSGSACSAKKGKSTVLSNFGLDESRQDSALRISLSSYNTREDVDILFGGIRSAVANLQKKDK